MTEPVLPAHIRAVIEALVALAPEKRAEITAAVLAVAEYQFNSGFIQAAQAAGVDVGAVEARVA